MTSFKLHVPRSATGGVVTIGNFDGVHRGHQAMLSTTRSKATELRCQTVIVTFDPHPITVLKPDVDLPRLSTISDRTKLLKQYGADEVVVLPVSRELLDMAPDQFFHEVVVQQLCPSGMVEGPDFRFGKSRSGDTELLDKFCEGAGIDFSVIDAVLTKGEMVSSTRIRRLLADGKITKAIELLGHPYTISGVVQHGAGRGRELGFPTANLAEIEVLLPRDGVYAAECLINATRYPVAMSIGPNPTFGEEARKVECHIVGFSDDIYDSKLSLNLLKQVRDLVSFDSLEDLVQQIRHDVAECVAICD